MGDRDVDEYDTRSKPSLNKSKLLFYRSSCIKCWPSRWRLYTYFEVFVYIGTPFNCTSDDDWLMIFYFYVFFYLPVHVIHCTPHIHCLLTSVSLLVEGCCCIPFGWVSFSTRCKWHTQQNTRGKKWGGLGVFYDKSTANTLIHIMFFVVMDVRRSFPCPLKSCEVSLGVRTSCFALPFCFGTPNT